MPEYLSPGVYVEEVETGPVPIEGVSTSTAGFVGVTERGPIAGRPVLVTNFADFRRRFGGLLPESFGDSRFLGYAVQGFFENGGQRVFIKRVPGEGALESQGDVLDGIVTRLQRDMAATPTTARLVSLRGVSVGTALEFRERVNGTTISETRAVTSYDTGRREVSWAGALGRAFTRDGTAVVVRAPAAPETLRFQARDPGRWGDDIRISFEDATPAQAAIVPDVVIPMQALGLTPAFAAAGPAAGAVTTTLAAGHGLLTADVVEFTRGEIRERREVTVAGDTITWTGGLQNDFSLAGSAIRPVTAARAGGAAPFQIAVAPAFAAALQPGDAIRLEGGGNSEEAIIDPAWPGGSPIQFTAPFAHAYLEGATLTLVGSAGSLLTLALTPTFATAGPAPGATSVALAPGHGVAAGDVVEFSDSTNQEQRTLTGVAGDTISWAGGLTNDYSAAGSSIRMVTAARAGVTTQLNVPAPVALRLLPGDAVRLREGTTTEDIRVDASWPAGTVPVLLATATVNSYREGATLTSGAGSVRDGATQVRVQSARAFYADALVEIDTGSQREYFTVTSIDGNDLTLSAPVTGVRAGNLVRLCELKLTVRYINDVERIDQTETFDGLSMTASFPEKDMVTIVNGRSALVRVEDRPGPGVPFPNPSTADGLPQRLAGGSDGTAPSDEGFVGEDFGPGQRTGIQALVDIDQVSIVAAPGKTSQPIQNALISQCELLKDRFAVLDPPLGASIEAVQVFRSQYDTKYAALYHPWVIVRDPLAGADRPVPPSGHIIGIYARVDNTRGVHKAPANEVIRGIVDLEQILSKREQDILNPSPVNINVLRDFRADGRGLRVFGARCTTSDAIFRYVSTRRLFIFIEESIDEGTQFAVFEPNDPKLWARLTQSVTAFLTRVWKDGALFGATPEEAFFVRCDLSTMTTDDLENGRLVMEIGIAPVKPAEFVIIRITQVPAGSIVEEL
jgi:uncharacterized protein